MSMMSCYETLARARSRIRRIFGQNKSDASVSGNPVHVHRQIVEFHLSWLYAVF
jgi:hypothetical protein